MSEERSTTPPRARAERVISVLRLGALALLVVGFSGWVIDDGGEIALESPFTIAFAVGLACALASIYLGIFLANGGE